MALMKIMHIMKVEGEGMFSITTSEKITVGVTKKKKTNTNSCGRSIGGSLYFAIEN